MECPARPSATASRSVVDMRSAPQWDRKTKRIARPQVSRSGTECQGAELVDEMGVIANPSTPARSSGREASARLLAAAVVSRSLRAVRGFVLARLLVPEVFGGYALIGALVGPLASLANIGLTPLVARERRARRATRRHRGVGCPGDLVGGARRPRSRRDAMGGRNVAPRAARARPGGGRCDGALPRSPGRHLDSSSSGDGSRSSRRWT